MGMFVLLQILAFVIGILALIRIFRTNGALIGVLTILVPFVFLYPLIKNWNDKDGDIKYHIAAMILFSVASVYFAGQAAWDLVKDGSALVVEPGTTITTQELEALRSINPDSAAMLEADPNLTVVDGVQAGYGRNAVTVFDEAPVIMDSSTYDRVVLEHTIRQIPFRRGMVRLELAKVTIEVPKRFRYASVGDLQSYLRQRSITLAPGVQGWLVHEKMSLADRTPWFVEVRFESGPPVALGVAGMGLDRTLSAVPLPGWKTADTAIEGADPAVASAPPDPFAPTWYPQAQVLSYERVRPGEPPSSDLYAVKPLAHGMLVFRVPQMDDARRELGLRAARLMALQTKVDADHAMVDLVENTGGQSADLVQWLTPRLNPGAAVDPSVAAADEPTKRRVVRNPTGLTVDVIDADGTDPD